MMGLRCGQSPHKKSSNLKSGNFSTTDKIHKEIGTYAEFAEGNVVNAQTGKVLEEIILLVNMISTQITTASTSITEQEKIVEEIADASYGIRDTSASNADALRQLSDSTEEVSETTFGLAELSDRLMEKVSHFKTENEQ